MLCGRSLEVARQRQGRHVLLQGFLTSAQNMMLLFMQVNVFSADAQRRLTETCTGVTTRARRRLNHSSKLGNIPTLRRHINVTPRSRCSLISTSARRRTKAPLVSDHDEKLLDAK